MSLLPHYYRFSNTAQASPRQLANVIACVFDIAAQNSNDFLIRRYSWFQTIAYNFHSDHQIKTWPIQHWKDFICKNGLTQPKLFGAWKFALQKIDRFNRGKTVVDIIEIANNVYAWENKYWKNNHNTSKRICKRGYTRNMSCSRSTLDCSDNTLISNPQVFVFLITAAN